MNENLYSPVYKRLAFALIFSPAIYLFFFLMTRSSSQDGVMAAVMIFLPLSLLSILLFVLSIKKFKSISQTASKVTISTGRILHIILVSFVVLLCLFLSATKGWSSFILFPTAFVAVFLYQRMQLSTNTDVGVVGMNSKINTSGTLALMSIQTLTILGFYVTAVGYDDTDRNVVFGFIASHADSALTMISNGLSILCAIIFIVVTSLIYKILIQRRRTS